MLNVAPRIDAPFVEAARTAGIKFYHAPLRDNSHVPTHDVQRLAQSVVNEVITGNSVMIHCNQARNRSALIAILAIIKLTRCEPTDAIRKARQIRPGVLKNKFFERFVREYCVSVSKSTQPTPASAEGHPDGGASF